MYSNVMIVTGPPGAGKSTTASALAKTHSRSVHLHADDFWKFIASGSIPPHRPESDEQNHVVMRVISSSAFAFANGGFTTVIDGIIGPWMLSHFHDSDDGTDAPRVHYVVLRPDRDETLRRAQGRTAPDSLVDAEPVLTMWDQFADLGPLEQHVIDTSDHEPARTLEVVTAAITSDRFLLKPSVTARVSPKP